MRSRTDFIQNLIERDRKIFFQDLEKEPKFQKTSSDVKIMADFTEYSPLHLGHHHCIIKAKEKEPDAIFVAIVPGLFERNGRGRPYIMTRHARAEAAVNVGADIVVEGPPMGIMGSGQYSLCLAKMFQALDTDFIPRGYKPVEGIKEILEHINQGRAVAPKPYKFVDVESRKVLKEGKLDEDNYVIVSLSKSLNKIGFNFKNKFIFVKRIEGVSGTKIREYISKGDFESAKKMLPSETIAVLKKEIDENRAPLSDIRYEEGILEFVNRCDLNDLTALNLIDDVTAHNMIDGRPFESIDQIEKIISWGFSRHYKQRILSSLEARINKDQISKYIDSYPPIIRILNFKNKNILKKSKEKITHRRLEIWQ
ncbi:MAG: nucleotidyltransferase family protein [Methanomicrobiales archaeon]